MSPSERSAASSPDVPEHLTAWEIVRDAEPSMSMALHCTDACISGECDCDGEVRVLSWRVDIPALRVLLRPEGEPDA